MTWWIEILAMFAAATLGALVALRLAGTRLARITARTMTLARAELYEAAERFEQEHDVFRQLAFAIERQLGLKPDASDEEIAQATVATFMESATESWIADYVSAAVVRHAREWRELRVAEGAWHDAVRTQLQVHAERVRRCPELLYVFDRADLCVEIGLWPAKQLHAHRADRYQRWLARSTWRVSRALEG